MKRPPNKLQKERNEVLRLLHPHKKHHYYGSNGFNSGSSALHEGVKQKLAHIHAQQGHSVLLEATFKDEKGRADLLCLDCRTIFEVVYSEKEASILLKRGRYPSDLEIKVVKVE